MYWCSCFPLILKCSGLGGYIIWYMGELYGGIPVYYFVEPDHSGSEPACLSSWTSRGRASGIWESYMVVYLYTTL